MGDSSGDSSPEKNFSKMHTQEWSHHEMQPLMELKQNRPSSCPQFTPKTPSYRPPPRSTCANSLYNTGILF